MHDEIPSELTGEALTNAVRLGFQQLDAGDVIEASEVYRRAEARIAEMEGGAN